MADKRHALMAHNLARLGQFAIAALLHRQIDENRARLHAFNHFARHQFGRRASGDQRRANDNVLLGNMLGDQFSLPLLIIRAHFLGVAALCFAAVARIGLDHDEGAAQAFHLLSGSRAHIRCADNRAQPLGRGNRLQARNTGPHNENPRRGYRACRCHHHGQGAVIFCGCIQHGLIASEIGLRGQNIHGLRARDARHQLHRHGLNFLRCHGFYASRVLVRVQLPDNHRIRLHGFDFRRRRRAHAHHHIGFFKAGDNRLGDSRACVLEIIIVKTGFGTSTGFNRDGDTQCLKFLDGLRRRRNTRLAGLFFFKNGELNCHHFLRKIAVCGRAKNLIVNEYEQK